MARTRPPRRKPKISRLTWNETRRPKRSDITPATSARSSSREMWRQGTSRQCQIGWPLLTKAASTAPPASDHRHPRTAAAISPIRRQWNLPAAADRAVPHRITGVAPACHVSYPAHWHCISPYCRAATGRPIRCRQNADFPARARRGVVAAGSGYCEATLFLSCSIFRSVSSVQSLCLRLFWSYGCD